MYPLFFFLSHLITFCLFPSTHHTTKCVCCSVLLRTLNRPTPVCRFLTKRLTHQPQIPCIASWSFFSDIHCLYDLDIFWCLYTVLFLRCCLQYDPQTDYEEVFYALLSKRTPSHRKFSSQHLWYVIHRREGWDYKAIVNQKYFVLRPMVGNFWKNCEWKQHKIKIQHS